MFTYFLNFLFHLILSVLAGELSWLNVFLDEQL